MVKIRVVLVEPLYEYNIGYVARAMKNFALEELYIVNPQTKIGSIARMMAAHAQDLLRSANIVESLEDALEDVDYVIGTTGKVASPHNFVRSVISVEELCKLIRRANIDAKIAILFGREDYGLTNEILRRCDIVVTIPANPRYPILNLSHAAVIIFYELYKTLHRIPEYIEEAPKYSKELLVLYLDKLLEAINYPEHKRRTVLLAFRRLIGRSMASKREIHVLYGVFRRTLQRLGVE